jgi:hypothetical protein
MTAASLPHSRDCRIEIESGNQHFHMKGDFLMDLNDHLMVRYCGKASWVRIADEIETLGDHCFAFCESLRLVRFGPLSRVASIEQLAFCNCEQLTAITIPSSVTFLSLGCFARCISLEAVSFCPGSVLDSIPDSAFDNCFSLKSIVVPNSIKTLGVACFTRCSKLESAPFAPDSSVVRICESAFSDCSSLRSLVVPSSVEVIEGFAFLGCDSLSTVTFGSPSHLRELLDLPPGSSGRLSIPDSVERLGFPEVPFALVARTPCQTLEFGRESRLIEIKTIKFDTGFLRLAKRHFRSFVHVSSGSLKVFRRNFEFDT